MVERINKPEAPPAYEVQATKETDDDQSRRENQEEPEGSDKKDVGTGWSKFSSRKLIVKNIKVPKNRIDKVLFRNTALRSGSCVLEAKIIWKDGRSTEPALFMMNHIENYMRLKAFKRGQIVPEDFWAVGPEIQIGVVQEGSITGSWNLKEPARGKKTEEIRNKPIEERKGNWLLKAIGLLDTDNKFQWFNLAMYFLIISLVGLVVLYAIL